MKKERTGIARVASLLFGAALLVSAASCFGGLPPGFEPVEWLESTGLQYIDTGVAQACDITFELEMACTPETAQTSKGNYSGAVGSSSAGWIAAGDYSDGYLHAYFCQGSRTGKGAKIRYDNAFHRYFLKDGLQAIDGETNTEGKVASMCSLNLYLFRGCDNYGGSHIGKQKIKWCKIWKGDELVRDLVPGSLSGEGCFVDCGTGDLFRNAGSDKFVLGPVLSTGPLGAVSCSVSGAAADFSATVNGFGDDATSASLLLVTRRQKSEGYPGVTPGVPPFDARLDYLEATGTQSLDAGVVAATNVIIEAVLSCTPEESSGKNGSGQVYSESRGWLAVGDCAGGGCLASVYGRGTKQVAQIPYDTVFHHYVVGQGLQVVDAVTNTASVSDGFPGDQKIRLFSTNFATERKQRIRAFRIWQAGVLVRDFVPCLKGSTPCFYERVDKTFYGENADLKDGPQVPFEGCDYPAVDDASHFDGEVDYVESDGVQYVDTGIAAATDVSVEAELASTTRTSGNNASGAVFSSNRGWFDFGNVDNQLGARFCVTEKTGAYIPYDQKFHHYVVSNGLQVVDTVTNTTTLSSFPEGANIYLGRRCAVGFEELSLMKMRIRSFRLWKAGELKKDYVPCKKDGVGCFYDRVSGEFVYSAGSRPFLCGPLVGIRPDGEGCVVETNVIAEVASVGQVSYRKLLPAYLPFESYLVLENNLGERFCKPDEAAPVRLLAGADEWPDAGSLVVSNAVAVAFADGRCRVSAELWCPATGAAAVVAVWSADGESWQERTVDEIPANASQPICVRTPTVPAGTAYVRFKVVPKGGEELTAWSNSLFVRDLPPGRSQGLLLIIR